MIIVQTELQTHFYEPTTIFSKDACISNWLIWRLGDFVLIIYLSHGVDSRLFTYVINVAVLKGVLEGDKNKRIPV